MNNTLTVSQKLTKPTVSRRKKNTKALGFWYANINKKHLIKLGAFVLILGLILSGFTLFNRAYADKVYPKVMVAGVNIGGLTREQAKTKIEEKIKVLNENGPEITYNDQTLKPKLDEMGLTFDIEKILNQAFDSGRTGDIQERAKKSYHLALHGLTIEIKPQIDQAKFDAYLGQLAAVAEKEPVNAGLAIHNGQVDVSPSENGRGLDKTKLKNDLTGLINSGQITGKIVMETSDFEAPITEDGTTVAKTQAEKYLASTPIIVTFETNTWTASRNEIGSWIKFNENGDKLVASVHPDAFISQISSEVDIAAQDREIEDGTGTVLKEGQDGRGTDTKTLSSQINGALESAQPATFALGTFAVARAEKTIYPHAQPGRFAGRYIDINLSEQTLYAFEGSAIVNQFLISSGKRGYATPTGEYSVWGKTASQLMDGPDYYLPNVPWISWFNGEISIHGTYWHSNFGTPMSHGCINASIPDAEMVYNFVEVGTPVYVHY